MPNLKMIGRVPAYANGEREHRSKDTREIRVEIADEDGVLIVDLGLSTNDGAAVEDDAPRLWVHWQKGIGWTIEVHKDERAPFANIRINENDLATRTTISRGFDNKIVDARKLGEE
jgi:hypothetical protein